MFIALFIYLSPINEKMKSFYKALFYLPLVISVPVICQAWVAMYNPEWGLINTLLSNMGLEVLAREWLSDENTVLFSLNLVLFWQNMGFSVMVFSSGLKTIPEHIPEAARIDGASRIQIAFKVLIPMMTEMLRFVILTSILGCMAVFAHVMIMTRGGPGDASYTLVYYLYNHAFARGNFGIGNATAVLYIIICLVFTVLVTRFIRRKENITF
jgi:multiple sugar transport system permease protein/raffinose/stachyose/melibiose transport system permease protein